MIHSCLPRQGHHHDLAVHTFVRDHQGVVQYEFGAQQHISLQLGDILRLGNVDLDGPAPASACVWPACHGFEKPRKPGGKGEPPYIRMAGQPSPCPAAIDVSCPQASC
jgi:hypothetical protein